LLYYITENEWSGTMVNHGFEAFRPGDHPYELGNGAVRRLAALTGVELGEYPNGIEIQAGFDAWGKEAVFRANVETFRARLPEGLDATQAIADIIVDSGVLRRVDPRDIEGNPGSKFDQVIIGGGVTNWVFRRARHVDELAYLGNEFGQAVLLGSNRPMGSETEARIPFVRKWKSDHDGMPPTENDYLDAEVSARLTYNGIESTTLRGGNEGFLVLVRMAVAEGLLDGEKIYVAQNAPAGSTFNDVRAIIGDDRVYFGSDTVAVARTDEQLRPSNALRYQNPFSAASALIRWVKAVHEVNQSRS
jgi:hypothetical protein